MRRGRLLAGLASLRWRLLAAVSVAVLLLWLLTGWFSYTKAQHEAEELMDGNLAQTGRLLLAITQDNEDDLGELAGRLATVRGAADNVYEPPLEFQLGLGDGTILARSIGAPDLPVLGVPGYSDILRKDGSWRVLNVASGDGRHRVQVSQSIGLRDRAALEVAGQTVLPLAIITPVLLLLIYVSVVKALDPLNRLARDVAARSADNLAALSRENVPNEVGPLVAAINRLFLRVARALDYERRFTADAAHELRTPLAAIKVQAQVAQLSRHAAQKARALRQIESGVDRATHLVEQLLRLARLDPLNVLPNSQPLDLLLLVEGTLANVIAANPVLTQTVRHELPPVAPRVFGDADLLGIALRNLMDNAIRYSPASSTIVIRLEDDGRGRVCLCVQDDGPGVPDELIARFGERFVRGRDSLAEGSGLGIAIVSRIMELHGGRFSAQNLATVGFAARLCGLVRVDRGAAPFGA